MYEKLYNRDFSISSVEYHVNYAFESRETFTKSEIAQFKYLDTIYTKKRISLEDENDPFGDIGEGLDTSTDDASNDMFTPDTGTDDSGGNPFGDIGENTGGFGDDDGGDPFGGGDNSGFDFDNASDDGGDLFGGDEDNQNNEQQKQKALLLDRAKSIKEDYDISRQIRANFPKKFLELQTVISNNINIADRTVLDKQEYDDTLQGIIQEYERMKELLSVYIEVMPKKPYEDIFATYVSIHTSLVRLKNLYIKITGLDKKDVELEESKYDNLI